MSVRAHSKLVTAGPSAQNYQINNEMRHKFRPWCEIYNCSNESTYETTLTTHLGSESAELIQVFTSNTNKSTVRHSRDWL